MSVYTSEIVGSEIEYTFTDFNPAKEVSDINTPILPLFLSDQAERRFGVVSVDQNHFHHYTPYNGGRFYADVGHPEFATAECASVQNLVLQELADRVIFQSLIDNLKGKGVRCAGHANNTSGELNPGTAVLESHGYHLNVNGDATANWGKYNQMMPFLITAQIYTGNGIVLRPDVAKHFGKGRFGLSQRALAVNLDGSTLKVGTTILAKRLIETGWKAPFPSSTYRDYADAFKEIALQQDGWFYNLGNYVLSAIDTQYEYWEAAEKRFGDDPNPETQWTLSEWPAILASLQLHTRKTFGIDWVNKLYILEKFGLYDGEKIAEVYSDNRQTDQAVRVCHAYHSVDPEQSLYAKTFKVDWSQDEAVIQATQSPPADTRAFGRGMIVKAAGQWINKNPSRSVVVQNGWTQVTFNQHHLLTPDPHLTYEDRAATFIKQHLN